MRNVRVEVSATNEVGEETLRKAPRRLMAFLHGLSDPAIRASLVAHGWSERHGREGFALITELSAFVLAPLAAEKDHLAAAVAACTEACAGPILRARVILEHSHPAQAALLFRDFLPGAGGRSVLSVALLLERIDDLEASHERDPSRTADGDALALVSDAGLDRGVRAELARLVMESRRVPPDAKSDAGARAAVDAARLQLLRRMYAWLAVWSTVARTCVSRRDHLIRLGLAKRRPPARRQAA